MAKRPQNQKSSPEAVPKATEQARQLALGDLVIANWKVALQALVIVAAVFWIYWPALHGGWLWDDDVDITGNAIIKSPGGLWSIWFEPGSQFDYYPIKASVQWGQWQLWGGDTLGYHLTNIFLHMLGALLTWCLLGRFGLKFAWIGGLLFAIHPVNVESVAWIAELKNTLSLPPFLLAMIFWINYDEHGRWRDYAGSVALFLVAMLCKTSMAVLPLTLLLHAWWKRGRITWRDLARTIPYFAIALVLGLVTIHLQDLQLGSDPAVTRSGFTRLVCAGVEVFFYLGKFVMPVGLMPIYPRWSFAPPSPLQLMATPLLAIILAGLWTQRRGFGRHVLLGFGFFLLNLLPMIGFFTFSYLNISWVADHFVYLPMIGLIGLVVAGLEALCRRLSAFARPFLAGAMAVMAFLLAWESREYAEIFVNQETFWTYTLRHNPEAYPAHTNLGNALVQAGRISEAIEEYEKALRISPDYPLGHYNLGNALFKAGRIPEAVDQYREALKLNPNYVAAYDNLGYVLLQAGRVQEAIEELDQSLKINPDFAETRFKLGNALFQAGRVPEAIEQYEQALRINPDDIEAHNNLAVALLHMGRIPEAMEQFEAVLRLDPRNADAKNNLAKLQALQKTAPTK